MKFEDVEKIVSSYGVRHQMVKSAEELNELATVILQDYCESGKINIMSVIEEMADVYIMLEQLKIIYGIDSRDIDPMIEYKIERTLNRTHDNKIKPDNSNRTNHEKEPPTNCLQKHKLP